MEEDGGVRAEGRRMLCDVLLDQGVLPGVGNIIKNEALFDSGLHPSVTVAVSRETGSVLSPRLSDLSAAGFLRLRV